MPVQCHGPSQDGDRGGGGNSLPVRLVSFVHGADTSVETPRGRATPTLSCDGFVVCAAEVFAPFVFHPSDCGWHPQRRQLPATGGSDHGQ
jgi:hypothetical protein